jgi:hypothetical protein
MYTRKHTKFKIVILTYNGRNTTNAVSNNTKATLERAGLQVSVEIDFKGHFVVCERLCYLLVFFILTLRQTFMPPAGSEPAIPASEQPQTHALDRAATAIGVTVLGRELYLLLKS